MNHRTGDQAFLRETVWPLIRRDALIQNSCFGLPGSVPFPEGYDLPGAMHMGAHDTAIRRRRT
jgi:hypothetical protein